MLKSRLYQPARQWALFEGVGGGDTAREIGKAKNLSTPLKDYLGYKEKMKSAHIFKKTCIA